MNRQEIFDRISQHRSAMDDKYGDESLSSRPGVALPVLMEEVGEVATAILNGDVENLKDELYDVGQVIVAWLEGLE